MLVQIGQLQFDVDFGYNALGERHAAGIGQAYRLLEMTLYSTIQAEPAKLVLMVRIGIISLMMIHL